MSIRYWLAYAALTDWAIASNSLLPLLLLMVTLSLPQQVGVNFNNNIALYARFPLEVRRRMAFYCEQRILAANGNKSSTTMADEAALNGGGRQTSEETTGAGDAAEGEELQVLWCPVNSRSSRP